MENVKFYLCMMMILLPLHAAADAPMCDAPV